MRVYLKETRNEKGVFYRRGDWGIERPDGWDNGRGNWTAVAPPAESLAETDPIPCDWDETANSWIIDGALQQERTIKARLAELDATISRQNEDLISALEASGVTIKDKLYPAMSSAMAEKQKLRGELGR